MPKKSQINEYSDPWRVANNDQIFSWALEAESEKQEEVGGMSHDVPPREWVSESIRLMHALAKLLIVSV